MIVELLGVPGSGKTTMLERYHVANARETFLLVGNNSTPLFDRKKGFKSSILWFFVKSLRLSSVLMIPITGYLFFSSTKELLRCARSERISNVNNAQFIMLYLASLSYQLSRYLLSTLIHRITGKTILVDEGLIYNTIRLRTFVKPAHAEKICIKYYEELARLNVFGIWLKTDIDDSIRRFVEREQRKGFKRGRMSIYKYWIVDTDSSDWMGDFWRSLNRWHVDLVNALPTSTCVLELGSSEDEHLSMLADCLMGVERS